MNTISFERMQIVGFSGVLLLVLGCFTPLFHVPIVGTVNFIGNGQGDGVFLLGLAAIASVLFGIRAYRWALAPVAGAAVITLYTLVNFATAVSRLTDTLAAEKNNPLAAVASSFASTLSFEWGWVVLLLAYLCLFAATVSGWFGGDLPLTMQRLEPLESKPVMAEEPQMMQMMQMSFESQSQTPPDLRFEDAPEAAPLMEREPVTAAPAVSVSGPLSGDPSLAISRLTTLLASPAPQNLARVPRAPAPEVPMPALLTGRSPRRSSFGQKRNRGN